MAEEVKNVYIEDLPSRVSIRFRWRMAEEVGFRGQGSGGQLFKPNISPQIFSLKS